MSVEDDAVLRYVAGMRQLWGLADYGALAARLAPAASALIGAVGPLAGRRVLDLAAGTGTVALMAAEQGARASACDITPRMVERGRQASIAAGLTVEWREANAETLPWPDDSFDYVLSSFGLIFLPRPAIALTELRRVLRTGGLLGFTAWTPHGFMGSMTKIMQHWLPPPPGIADILDWGRTAVVWERLTDSALMPVRMQRLCLPWRFDSSPAMTEFLLAHSPAHQASARALGRQAGEMFKAVERLASPDGGAVRIGAEYLLTVAQAQE